MSDDYARFSTLIDRIYQGALEPGLWPVVIKEIADWMGAPKASMFSLTLPYDQGGFTYDHDLSPELDEA